MRALRMLMSCLSAAVCVSACQMLFPDDSETRIARMSADVQSENFEAAMSELEEARKYADGSSQRYMDFNRSVLDILAGKCDRAQLELDALLKLNRALDSDEETEEISAHAKFLAQLHYAYGTALLCPAAMYEWAEEADFEKALSHFYIAESLGLEISGEIAKVISEWFPPCRSFISQEQQPAMSAAHALKANSEVRPDCIVCKEGVWFKVDARAHEILNAKLELVPLNRKVWLDESSTLPFVQLRVDLYESAETGEPQGAPVLQYAYPLPNGEIPEGNWKSLNIDLPEVVVEHSGVHYIHFYTIHNGEAQLYAHFSRSVDCGKIDDTVTYTEDLRQRAVKLESGKTYSKLMLCVGRPDRFEIELESGQQGLFGIEVPAQDRSNMANAELTIYDAEGNRVPENDGEMCKKTGCFRKIRHKTDADLKDNYGVSSYAILKNDSAEKRTYYLEIAQSADGQPNEYNVSFAASGHCTGEAEAAEQVLQLEDIEKTRYMSWQPIWLCPHQFRRHHPQLGTTSDLLRATVKLDYIGYEDGDSRLLHFESYMMTDIDAREYSVETGALRETHWQPERSVVSFVLQKPVTRSVHFRSENETRFGMFESLEVILPEDESSEDKQSEENRKEEKEKKDKQGESKDRQDKPNKNPEKPSETAATPQGKGSDTEGEESTPDEHAKGNKAAQYDPRQHEKDHIDALMDDMERGLYYVPLPGQLPEKRSGKDW